MSFIAGLIVGLLAGGTLGVLIVACLAVGSDHEQE